MMSDKGHTAIHAIIEKFEMFRASMAELCIPTNLKATLKECCEILRQEIVMPEPLILYSMEQLQHMKSDLEALFNSV